MRRPVLVLALLVGASGLTGCSREDARSVGYAVVGAPIAGTPSGRFLEVALVAAERTLLVMTTGSGSCPTVPVRLDVLAPGEVEVRLDGYYGGECTGDAGPTTTLVRLPDEVDVTRPLTVVLEREDEAQVRLVARRVARLPDGTRPVG